MPGSRTAFQAVEIGMTAQIRYRRMSGPCCARIFGHASAVLAEEDLGAAVAKPKRLARSRGDCIFYCLRWRQEADRLALGAVAQVRGKMSRRWAVVPAVECIGTHQDCEGTQGFARFTGRGLGIQHGGDIALARHGEDDIYLGGSGSDPPSSCRSAGIAGIVRDSQRSADKDVDGVREVQGRGQWLMGAGCAVRSPCISPERSQRDGMHTVRRELYIGYIADPAINGGRAINGNHADKRDN